MGADIHLWIQIFDPIARKYVLVREESSNNVVAQLGEHCRITIRKSSDSKLVTITSEELDKLRKEHKDCEDMKCECQNDFNISFGINRDYAFFAKIANVRSYGDKKNDLEPRGLPVDLDNVVRNTLLESEEDTSCKGMSPFDLHSHTFFYDTEVDAFDFEDNGGLKEFKVLLERVRNNFHYCSCRFLIAFDN